MKARKFLCSITSIALVVGLMPSAAFASEPSAAASSETDAVQIEGTAGVDYAEGEVLVAVLGGQQALEAATGTSQIARLLGASDNQAGSSSFSINGSVASVSVSDIENAATDLGTTDEVNLEAGSNVATLSSTEADDVEIISLSCDDVAQAIADLRKLDCVVVAQPSYYYDFVDDDEATTAAATEATTQAASLTSTESGTAQLASTGTTSSEGVDEPFFDSQWSLQNEASLEEAGYTGTTSLNAEDAWAAGAGDEDNGEVVVAVIDSGVDYTHEDMKANMWTGGDADWSTALGGGTYGLNLLADGATNDPMDFSVGHGTHCATTIAAAWNDTGIAGINNDAKIMAVRAVPGTTSATVAAYNYVITAKKNDVDVVAISNSWGPSTNTDGRDTLLDALIYKAGTEGIISVFAAGNAGLDNDLAAGHHHNNANPYLLEIGALNSNGQAVNFTQYGERAVDVFSPGVRVLAATTTYGAKTGKSLEMDPQYLPWVKDSASNASEYFLEDAADTAGPDGITYDLVVYDSEHNIVHVGDASILNKGYNNEGYNNNQSLKFSLKDAGDALNAGLTAAVRITIPAKTWQAYKEQNRGDNLYISAVGAFNGDNTKDAWVKTCVRTATKWEELTFALNGERDSNWYAFSTSTSFSQVDNGKGDNGDVTILLNVHGVDKATLTDDDYLYLDNISLGWATCSGAGTSEADDGYYYSDGTSMATPNAAGTVSLLCSHAKAVSDDDEYLQTADTAKEIVSFIKGGVTQLDSLSNKCSTGGVVNAASSYTAYKAYEEAETAQAKLDATASLKPVPDSISDNGDGTSTLHGSFFGADKGSVTFKGAALTITKWTDSEITFESLSAAKEQVGEVVVTKANGLTGQSYLILPAGSDSANAFTTLSNPDFPLSITYTNKDGIATTIEGNASEVTPLHMAAAGGYIYVYGYIAWTLPVLLRYDIAARAWDEKNYLEAYADKINVGQSGIFSMAAGSSEVYFKYVSTDPGLKLMTLDAATGAVKTDVPLASAVNSCGSLGVLKGKLYLVGGIKGEPACSAVYPDTGAIYWTSETTLPENAIFGNVTSTGFGFAITGSYSTTQMDNNGYKAGVRNNQIDIAIPNAKETFVTVSTDVFFPQEGAESQHGLDDGQGFATLGTAAVDGAVIVTGPVRNNEADNMVDTWIYSAQTETWSAVETVRFAPTAEWKLTACTYDGLYYVLATDMQQENTTLRFASFPIASWGLTDDMVTQTADAAKAPSLADATVSEVADQMYTGEALEPALTVSYDGTELVAGTDYTVSYKDNVNAGTATVTITGTGTYVGSVEKTFTIAKRNVTLTSASASKVYDGTPLTADEVVVTGDGWAAGEGATYTVTGSQTAAGSSANAFTYELSEGTLAANYNVTTVEGTLKVTGTDIAACTIEIPTQSWTGAPVEPNPIVSLDGTTLVEGVDYTVSYENNVAAGTATAVVTGTGSLTGSKTVTFTIEKAAAGAVKRLAGANAMGTMTEVVKEGWKDGSCDTVVLATSNGYWDALAASALAGLNGCPVLLTAPDSLSAEALAQIDRLGAKKVIIVGGTSAVSVEVQVALEAKGLSVKRAAGDNAVGTAIDVYKQGKGSWGDTCIVAASSGYYDALSASPYAYANQAPIFLANVDGSISAEVTDAIEAAGFTRVVIVGGTAAVTEDAEFRLSLVCGKVVRYAGDNCFGTSAAFAEFCVAEGMTMTHAGFATGLGGYWDSLTGAALCGMNKSPLLLVDDGCVQTIALTKQLGGASAAYIFGGTAAVSEDTAELIAKAAK